jgi:hypothetical protein
MKILESRNPIRSFQENNQIHQMIFSKMILIISIKITIKMNADFQKYWQPRNKIQCQF